MRTGIRISGKVFVGLVTGSAILVMAVMVCAGFWIHARGGLAKDLGWTAGPKSGAWIVLTVDPNGPAAGKLQPGDRILEIEGNPDAARIGHVWILRDRPFQPNYSIRVAHAGGPQAEYRLDWPVRVEPYQQFWLWVMLAVGAIYLGPGLMIAYAKPNDAPGRRAVVSGLLNAGFFTAASLNPRGGTLDGTILVVAALLFCIRPYHVLASYRFTAGFPAGEFRTPGWHRFEMVLWTAGALAFIPSACSGLIRALGAESAARWVAKYPIVAVFETTGDGLVVLVTALGAAATTLVCRRNYRRLEEGDQKRRLRWVILGVVLGVLPIIVLFPLLLMVHSARERLLMVRVINTFAALSPLCIGYAVIVHRVLGIRMVLRTGLRYLLARNSLRFAVFIPLALMVFSIVVNPQRTVADLVLGPTGKFNLALLALSVLALMYRTSLLNRIDRRFFREAYQQDQIFITLAEAVGRAADVVEISRLLSTQIQAALHPRAMFAVSRESGDEFTVVFSSTVGPQRRMEHFGLSPATLEALDSSTDLESDSSTWSGAERTYLESLGVRLIVPIRGPNEGLVGVMLLGEKMSEEPYTRHDRRLLDTVAAQTGVAWENVQLRDQLKREQQVRHQVVAGLEGTSAGFVLECPACGACYDSAATVCANDGRALSPSLPIARTIDSKYRLTRRIGRGGMGAVYLAEDLRLDRAVAVKIMVGRLFGDAYALQRFAREARASAKLDHPNVVRIFDFGELTGGGAYLVLEYLRGVTLRREIQQRRALPPGEVAALLQGVMRGVEAAHARGVIHRDLKPDNIFLVRETPDAAPVTKILDFGLAVVRDLEFSDRKKLTHTGTALGTLGYMSREQFMGEPADERTDVYSLGIIILEMLTGELALKGPAFSQIADVVQRRLPAEHVELTGVLLKALREDREHRYGSVAEFRECLLGRLERCPPLPLPAEAAAAAEVDSSVETSTQVIDLGETGRR